MPRASTVPRYVPTARPRAHAGVIDVFDPERQGTSTDETIATVTRMTAAIDRLAYHLAKHTGAGVAMARERRMSNAGRLGKAR